MDVISNPVLDFKTLTAIVTANPEGMAIIGAWNGMETLAREDPEGCVRLCPGLPMDNSALAMKREKDRIRKAKSRARQKQAGMT